MSEMTLAVACRLETIALASAAVRAMADRHLNAADGPLVEIAVSEVCSNIVRHGHPDDPGHEFTVTVHGASDSIEIEIRDSGPAFSFAARPMPDVDVPLEELPEGGFGIALVYEVMDVVEFSRHDGTNVVRLVKYARPMRVEGR